jgi:hypothetical protein
MPGLPINKLCNAFLPDAAPSGLLPEAVLGAVRQARKRTGGLWVGGRVNASADALVFTPNGMNVALHAGLDVVRIPLAKIRAVRREFGWLTGIVVVEHAQGEFRFRCFGAMRVAQILSPRVPVT